MKRKNAAICQKITWHFRWALMLALIIYNLYYFFNSFTVKIYLPVHGFSFALYFLLGLLEGYFTCIASCDVKRKGHNR